MSAGSAEQDIEPPNRLPWPPMIYGAAVLAGIALGWALPVEAWPGGGTWRALGWALLLGGLALDVAAMVTMTRHRANILPHRAATALVTTGPFAWSRNPIYLGNTVALSGAGLAFANPWLIAAALLAAAATGHLAIRREEAHLAQLFGEEWQAYCQRTRRWLGR